MAIWIWNWNWKQQFNKHRIVKLKLNYNETGRLKMFMYKDNI